MGQVLPGDLSYPANHLSWHTIHGEHFDIHFQEGNEQSAQVVSAIADAIYYPVTEFYNHHPKQTTSIVLRDRDDYSNGAAYFYDNKIEIFLPSFDMRLRGTHNWLRNVITHEFTHIVQLDAAKKSSRNLPAIYFQWLSYEDVRRPDILYGFPNAIVTFPFSNLSIPPWFAEGAAQYQHSDLGYDSWDTHRDMVLRTRIQTDTYLSLKEMAAFSSNNNLERELIYNQGFALVRYLVYRFGEDILPELTRESARGAADFNRVLEKVTGVKAEALFDDWIAHEKEKYQQRSPLPEVSEETSVQYTVHDMIPVERSGFYNFHPMLSPDGKWLAYLTNSNSEHEGTRLVIRSLIDETSDGTVSGGRDNDSGSSGRHGVAAGSGQAGRTSDSFCQFYNNKPERIRSGSRFSFSAEQNQIAFSQAKKNRYGEHYNDLYVYDTETETTTQITHDKRIFDLDWHPGSPHVTGVMIDDGKQNIVVVNTDTGEITRITDLPMGTSAYTPVWSDDQESILFSAANQGSRNLYRTDREGRIRPVLSDSQVDFRDPFVDHTTGTLYFSADYNGVFNIYRHRENDSFTERLTQSDGGAFMPFAADNEIYFSDYHADGYKISKIHYQPDGMFVRQPVQSREDDPLSSPDPLRYEVRTIQPYSDKATPLNIYPVIRFDNYTRLHGGNARLLGRGHIGKLGENLWRDMKIGAYLSSRDVTESLSLFGGFLLGPGSNPEPQLASFFKPSRLLDADRDIFFTVDYAGLPFIKRSWSPTISFEFTNMVRNVSDGLQIEEFPCTSCLPETRNIDIRYIVWEAGLFLRSKLNRWSLLETGLSYSPYRVKTDGFYSLEYNESIAGSSSEYFRGFSFTAANITDATLRDIHADIAPKGVRAEIRYRYEPGKLLRGFEIEGGSLSPSYETEKNHSIELKSRVGFPVGKESAVHLTSRFFSFFNSPRDYFYLDYSGGLSGLRSYPFFAIGGQRTFFIRSSLLMPLITDINRGYGPLIPDKIFAHIYAETGNGYGGPLESDKKLKNGIGAELRFSLNSYYLFPLKFFINTAYGFNQFEITLPAGFQNSAGRNNVKYGREILFYFGLTFDFDLL